MSITTDTYFYILKSDNSYKFGVLNNTDKRIKQLQAGSSTKIELYHRVLCQHPYDIEVLLKKIFSDNHIRGEWYKLSNEDALWLKLNLYPNIDNKKKRWGELPTINVNSDCIRELLEYKNLDHVRRITNGQL